MKRDWTEARAKVDREGRCRLCHRSDGHIEAAHLVPRSLGGGMDAAGIVPLCRECHSAFDGHKVDLQPYLSHFEQAETVRVLGLERARARLLPSAYDRQTKVAM